MVAERPTQIKSKTQADRFSGSCDWPKFELRNLRIFFRLVEETDDVDDADADADADATPDDNVTASSEKNMERDNFTKRSF